LRERRLQPELRVKDVSAGSWGRSGANLKGTSVEEPSSWPARSLPSNVGGHMTVLGLGCGVGVAEGEGLGLGGAGIAFRGCQFMMVKYFSWPSRPLGISGQVVIEEVGRKWIKGPLPPRTIPEALTYRHSVARPARPVEPKLIEANGKLADMAAL
jgi:hypothetical protein